MTNSPTNPVATVDVRITKGVNAEYNALYFPTPSRGKRGVILLPGAGIPNVWTPNTAFPQCCELGFAIARAGIPCLAIADASTITTDSWANDAAMTAITNAIAYLGAQTGALIDKIHLIGVSMGGGAGNRYTALNPGKVATWTGIISLASLFPLYANNTLYTGGNDPGSQQGINTAWGLASRTVNDASITSGSSILQSATAAFTAADVNAPLSGPAGIPAGTVIGSIIDGSHVNMAAGTAWNSGVAVNATATAAAQTVKIWAPLPNSGSPNADILNLASAIKAAGIPCREYYDTNDPYITQADTLQLGANSGAQLISVGALGHTDAAIGAVDATSLIAFLMANGA